MPAVRGKSHAQRVFVDESIPVYMNFGTYSSMRKILLGPGESGTVSFDDWTASPGNYDVTAFTALPGDPYPNNDTAYGQFNVPNEGYRDVGVTAIIKPSDWIVTCHPCTVTVEITNYGIGTEVCSVYVDIWRYRVQFDSLCHISVNLNDSVLMYTEAVEAIVDVGANTVYLPSWHPYWSDIFWVGGTHKLHARVKMDGDMNPDNDNLATEFTVKARNYDLQSNYVGLLSGLNAVRGETINLGNVYATLSVISNSPFGPAASFRAWLKIYRVRDNNIVYSRYADRTLAPGAYACIYYQSNWIPTQAGWYRLRSDIQTRAGVDSVARNNSLERLYYVRAINPSVAGTNTKLPLTFALLQNNPNPFFKTTAIRFEIPVESKVTISVYDACGRNIKTLVNAKFVPGYYNTIWDCTDANNRKVSAGIYFYEMRTNNYSSRLKMVIAH
jgi:hypothetical protein